MNCLVTSRCNDGFLGNQGDSHNMNVRDSMPEASTHIIPYSTKFWRDKTLADYADN